MTDFTEHLSVLCSKEMAEAVDDDLRMAAMIERLASALGMTIAIFARGDGATIDDLMQGAEGYAYAEAVAKAPLARFMAGCRSGGAS